MTDLSRLAAAPPGQGASAQETMMMRFTDEPKTLAEVRPDIAWEPIARRR